MSADGAHVGTDELRALVREVLMQAIPGGLAAAGAAGSGPTGDEAAREVRVSSDADLAALVQRIAAECADPSRRQDLLAGRVGYRLAGAPAPAPEPGADAGAVTVLRIERGAVTERHVREAARNGATVVAARGVVVTPLARDRARISGVDIEKEH
jgi:hypothetical protein